VLLVQSLREGGNRDALVASRCVCKTVAGVLPAATHSRSSKRGRRRTHPQIPPVSRQGAQPSPVADALQQPHSSHGTLSLQLTQHGSSSSHHQHRSTIVVGARGAAAARRGTRQPGEMQAAACCPACASALCSVGWVMLVELAGAPGGEEACVKAAAHTLLVLRPGRRRKLPAEAQEGAAARPQHAVSCWAAARGAAGAWVLVEKSAAAERRRRHWRFAAVDRAATPTWRGVSERERVLLG
jgi:hypothetical protein